MELEKIILAETDADIKEIAVLAEEIWNQHFVPIIGKAQVDYMVEKFQSYPALKRQIETEGYEYYRLFCDNKPAGYMGIHVEEDAVFLSKLYIKEDCGESIWLRRLSGFLLSFARNAALEKIWLTCNKYNKNTLAVYDHLGFQITDEQVADIGNGFVMDDYILTYSL